MTRIGGLFDSLKRANRKGLIAYLTAGDPSPLRTPALVAAMVRGGAPGVLQGAYSYLLQDEHGQIALTHSVSAGLDYAMIGPEHAYLRDCGRAQYVAASDTEALDAARRLSRIEGIIPALESAHAVAEAIQRAPDSTGKIFIVNLSGRGDKDIDIYRENFPELDQQELNQQELNQR